MKLILNPGLLLALPIALAASTGLAAQAGPEADWPCTQRLVPELTAGTYWNGPALPAGADWRADPKVAALVAEIARRDAPIEEGDAKLVAFADSLSPDQRRTMQPE
jgi:hypothetical protein